MGLQGMIPEGNATTQQVWKDALFHVEGVHATPTVFAEDRAGNVWIGLYTGGLLPCGAPLIFSIDLSQAGDAG